MSTATQAEPKFLRSLMAMDATSTNVERKGGNYGQGLIKSVSVITEGEALGHDMWIDSAFLSDVADSINQGGVKARFTHPGLSSDGVGQKLGRFSDAYVSGDRVYADLHFQEAATKTPDGDLADYVMTLAEETPEDFGLSIAFEHDPEAEEEFRLANSINGTWVSPDENNKDNLNHVRLSRLRAGDVVDSPAANPMGLFQRGQETAQEAESLMQYVMGLSDAKPDSSTFNVDGDRAKQFIARFLERHNLSISKGGQTVKDDNVAVETPVVDVAEVESQFRDGLNQFITKFGAENGSKWYAEGKSFSDALELHCEELGRLLAARSAEVEELSGKLASLNTGDEPVNHGGEAESQVVTAKRSSLSHKIRISGKTYDQN